MKTLVCHEVLTDLRDLETALTGVDERNLLEVEGLLMYLSGPQWIAVSSGGLHLEEAVEDAQRQAVDRLSAKRLYFAPDPAWLCTHSAYPQKARNYQPVRFDFQSERRGTFEQLDKPSLDALIECAMCAAVAEGLPRCVVRAPAGQHFELPSRAHASHFIRLSEAFDCVESVQRAAYWIVVSLLADSNPDAELPERLFLVDHPSMLLLGTHVNQMYGGQRQVATLKAYPSEAALRTQASKLLATDVPVTAIIGIASTGRLAGILQELALAKGTELEIRIAFTAVEAFEGPKPLARLAIANYSHTADAASCRTCAAGGPPPIHIHGHSFFITVAPPTEIKLKPAYFQQQRQFLDKYGSVPGALRVHFDDPNDLHARHHAFGIDVTVLLSEAEFFEEVLQALESLHPKPDFVVIPNHKASELLRQVVHKWRGLPVVTIDKLSELQGFVPQRPNVLVLDDKIVSGQRMRDLNDALRQPRRELWGDFSHVHFFAPVVTPKSAKQLEELRRGLTTNHPWKAELHYLYCVSLPDWHTPEQCPWCDEERVIAALAQESDALDSPIVDRLGILRSSEALHHMGCLACTPGQEEFPALANGSVALDAGASQLQLLLAAASAVQQLRTDVVMPLDPFSLTHPTKMARFSVEDAYSEKLLACAILRSLKATEVSTAMQDYLANALRFPKSYRGMHLYQIEVAMALLAGKLGTLKDIGAAWDVLRAYGVREASLRELGFTKPPSEA